MSGRRTTPLRVAISAPVSLAPEEMRNRTAAFRKVKLILAALADLGCATTLVESLHVGPRGGFRPTRRETAALDDGRPLDVLRPFSLPFPRLTKAAQALAAPALARRLAADFAPDAAWIYNGYLFEARWALALARRGAPFILQLEDWPTARPSFPCNIKTALDARMFDETVRRAAAVLCVNSDLRARIGRLNRQVFLFPPIVDPALERAAASRAPPFAARPIRVGYCGGLDHDKGAGVLLDLLDRLPPHMELHVAGVGPLAAALSAALARRPDRGRFHGFVPDDRLADFLCAMDVLVNPHRDIKAMNNAVFPFKVFEYLAAGAAVVTTPLPPIEGLPLERLIHFDGSAAGLAAALERAAERGAAAVDEDLRREVSRRFGLSATTALIGEVLAVATGVRPSPT